MRGARIRYFVGVALAVALIALLGVVTTGTAAAAPLSPCTTPAGDRALCGRVAVPLDRSGALPGAVRLRVRALPPRRGRATTGTVLALAGGPGQAAVPLLDDFATVLGPALRTRQLVTFDQRGTGGSGRLRCAALSGRGSLVEVVGRCAGELGPRRTTYTSATSVADVEAVRAALGVERLILFGASYGTKVALMYAATYPQHVERLVLDSVVPPQGVDPFQRATLASIPRVVRTLCAGDCAFTRDPAVDLARLARRLAHRPLRGSVIDGDGRSRHAAIGEPGLLALLLAGDFDRFTRAATPAAVRAALNGDVAPLLRLTARSSAGVLTTTGDSDALYAATTCEDGAVPWPPGTPTGQRRPLVDAAARAIPDTAFAPFDRATVRALGTADLCRAWPESPIVQTLPPLPPVPTLILSGDDDLRTPRADAAALAAQLPDVRLLRVHDAAHGVLFSDATDCAVRGVADFLDGRSLGRCRPLSRAVPPSPLPPQRLGALRPAGRVSGRTGRTVTAIVRTLDDATEQLVAQLLSGGRPRPFGGLRAGSALLERGRGLRLRDYVYVPGVVVGGTIPPRGARFTVTVGGAAAARGRVAISRDGLAGVLGGERVTVSARALGWRSVASAAAAHGTLPAPSLRDAPAPSPPAPLALPRHGAAAR
jgi:pimeloyl-ACP methyl ester carboxylesterase